MRSGVTFENQKRYDIHRRRAQAITIFSTIADHPGITRKEIASIHHFPLGRVGEVIRYLIEHTDLIEQYPYDDGGVRRYRYRVKSPLSQQGADFISRDEIFRNILYSVNA